MVMINLKRINHCHSQKVLISHFPKPKEAGYFLIVGCPAKNDILAIKRLAFNRFTTKNLTIALPEDFKKDKLELHLMCDSYIGLDQYHYIDLLNINALMDGTSKGSTSKQVASIETPKTAPTESKAFTGYKNLQQEILDDIFDEEEEKKALATKGKLSAVLDEDDVGASQYR